MLDIQAVDNRWHFSLQGKCLTFRPANVREFTNEMSNILHRKCQTFQQLESSCTGADVGCCWNVGHLQGKMSDSWLASWNVSDYRLPECLTFKLSNFQTFKLSNFQTFKLEILQTFKLSKFQTFKLSKFEKNSRAKNDKFSNFESLKDWKFESLKVWKFEDVRKFESLKVWRFQR